MAVDYIPARAARYSGEMAAEAVEGAHGAEVASNVIMHVILFSLFVGFFFFVIARPVERWVVKRETKATVESVMKDVRTVLPDEASAELDRALQSLKAPDMKEADAKVAKSNSRLTAIAVGSLVSLFVAGLAVVLILFYVRDRQPGGAGYSIKHLMGANFIILFFVAVTETVFLLGFGSQYKSLDPNAVKRSIVAAARSYARAPDARTE